MLFTPATVPFGCARGRTTGMSVALRWDIPFGTSADLVWIADGATVKIHTTYVGHGLQSLLQAAVDLQSGSSSAIAYLPGEPAGHLILFSGAHDDDMFAEIVTFPRMEDGGDEQWRDGRRRLAARISVSAFIRAVIGMADVVLAEHGEAGYARQWRGLPFPKAELDILTRRAGQGLRPTAQ